MAWINFNNGDTGLDIRNKLNTFLTTVDAFLTGNNQYTDAEKAQVATNKSDITALDVRVTAEEADPISQTFVPQSTPPAHTEGTVYYSDDGSFKLQGPISGIEVAVGHDMHIHVINNSGATLTKGMAVRNDGVAAGKIQVVPAIATSFDNARVFGVVQEDIANGADGAINTFGEISDVDTNGQPIGVPLYLSDTVAGTYGPVAPDIVTRVGGALTADALTGRFFVAPINNTTLPTVLGGLKDHTPGNEVYAVTTTPQDINNFLVTETVVTAVDPLTGIITLPNVGEYRMNFTASISFPTSTSTRTVTFEVYDVTGAVVGYEYIKNIPRDAIQDSMSFNFPFYGALGNQYKMRIKSNVAISVTFDNVSFDIESVNIR